jgi:hypothetical protein
MRRLSSKRTFFYKKVFPLIWFLAVAGAAVGGICAALSKSSHAPPAAILFLIFPAFMSIIGHVVMKNLVFDLLDEVWDEGDSLVLVKGDERETIHITDIINVSDTTMVNPPRITLLLRQPCRFGKEVVFSPARGFWFNPFKRSAIAQELIERVHGI